ncbi:MAG: ABC transporter substrate-binding protein [Sporolactobacillus sp.]
MAERKQRKHLTRWIVSIVIIVAVVIASIVTYNRYTTSHAASGATIKKDHYVLRLADETGVCGAPQQIAVAKKFFKKVGLNYKIVKLSADTNGIDAITANKVDASNTMLAALVQPLANGARLKITTGLHTGCVSILTGKGTKITSAKQLKGKKIGVAEVAGSEATFTKRYLANAGLNVSTKNSDVQFVTYDASDLPIALSKGQVDAIAIEDPDTEIAVKHYGFHILASMANTKPFNTQYCCVAYVSDQLAQQHPEIARKYTLAMQEATNWVAKHRTETARIQVKDKYAAGNPLTNLAAMKTYNWKASYNGGKSNFVQVAHSLQKIGVVDKNVDVKALVNHSFLKVKGVR